MTVSATDVFLTVTEKVTVPPGSWIETGPADFITVIALGRFAIVTVASSSSLTGLPSSSVPEAVTTSVCRLPALPETAPMKEQS